MVRKNWDNLELLEMMPLPGHYKTSYFHKFRDENGDILVWFSSREKLERGCVYHGRATIKEHKKCRESQYTVLTRCSFERKEKQ